VEQIGRKAVVSNGLPNGAGRHAYHHAVQVDND